MRFPRDICPRVTCVAYVTIGETHLIDGCVCEMLRDVMLLQPMNECTQWRSFGIGFEQTVVLHTLEHNEPVPIFPDKDKTLRDVHVLDTFQNMIQRFGVTARDGGDCVCHKAKKFYGLSSIHFERRGNVYYVWNLSALSKLGLADE